MAVVNRTGNRSADRAIDLMQMAQAAINQGNRAAADNYAQAAYAAAQRSGNANVAAAVVNHANSWGPAAPQQPSSGQDTSPQGSSTPQGPSRYVLETFQQRRLGGVVVTMRRWSDGTVDEEPGSSRTDKSAGEAAKEIFRAAGLDDNFVNSLMASIDAVYAANIDPSEAQILSSIYNSDAYKQRFAGNEIIRKRMADGQGRPGDRLLNPKEYIDAENAYRTILQDAGMPTGFYDQPDDFNNLIGNSVSVAEFKSRVDTASEALNYADPSVVNSLSRYYNMTRGDLVSYLLDPSRAMPILENRAARAAQAGVDEFGLNSRTELQRMFEASKVGGMADRQGLGVDRGFAEEIVDLGKSDQAEEAIATAGALDADVRRLGSLYGEPLDFKDLVRESLNMSGGVEAGRKRRKFASKERAAFGAQGALDKKSLSRMQDI